MILVKPSFEILKIMGVDYKGNGYNALHLIEKAGRTCYKSEDKSGAGANVTALRFVEKILKSGHESVIEHSAMTVKVICDRGVTHEIVRHRIGSYSQESTRYVNYKGGCTFIIPPWIDIEDGEEIDSTNAWYTYAVEHPEDYSKLSSEELWVSAMAGAELDYINLITKGWTPQKARSVLPSSTKTEIVITYNFREWRHFFKLRTANAAHPQMQEIARPLLDECKNLIPVIFDDIVY